MPYRQGVVNVWRSASKSGHNKTLKSKRSLELPKRAIAALTVHQARQANERRAAGDAWHDNDLVFCHENGAPYTSDQLNWRFCKRHSNVRLSVCAGQTKIQDQEFGSVHRTSTRKIVELRGFEPLTFCMPCSMVSSDGVALSPVTALQSRFGVWGRRARSGEI